MRDSPRITDVVYLGLGLACHSAAPPCQRVGVAVWVDGGPRRVTVLIHGRRIVLTATRTFWQGFFRDPLVARHADHFTSVSVLVSVVPEHGPPYTERASVPVSAGWG